MANVKIKNLSKNFDKKNILNNINLEINNEEFDGDLAGLQTEVSTMIDNIEAEDIAVGTSLDTSGYAKAMTEMMAAAGVDIDTINSILAGVGFEPEVSY